MARPLAPDEIAFFQQVGRKLRELRNERGWTLDAMSQRADTVENYARMEKGQNLTLALVHRLARALGVQPADLLQPPAHATDLAQTSPAPLEPLLALGWRLASQNDRAAGALPAFDLQAAAGRNVRHGTVDTLAWVLPPIQRRLTSEGLFLGRAAGTSMEPLIPNGAWCLFRAPVVPPLVRKIVLVQQRPIGDAESGGGYLIKRVGAIEADETGGRLRVRLDSIARSQGPLFLEVDDETELQAQGELVEVLAPRTSPGPKAAARRNRKTRPKT